MKAQAAVCRAEALKQQEKEHVYTEAAPAQAEVGSRGTRAQSAGVVATSITISVRCAEDASDHAQKTHSSRSIAPATSLEFDAFAASTSKETVADSSADTISAARRLLNEMRPQGFQVAKASTVGDGAPHKGGSVQGLDRVSVANLQQSVATADAEPEESATGKGDNLATAVGSLSQFAFKSQIAEPNSDLVSAKKRRRDVVTRTRFAHRTKLLTTSEEHHAPFCSLQATAANVGCPTGVRLPVLGMMEEQQLERKSIGFLSADDADTSPAFLSIHFSQGLPRKPKCP